MINSEKYNLSLRSDYNVKMLLLSIFVLMKEIEGELVRLRAEPSVISNFQLCLIIIQTFFD